MSQTERPIIHFSLGENLFVFAHEIIRPPISREWHYHLQQIMLNARKIAFSFSPLIVNYPGLLGFNKHIWYPEGTLHFERSKNDNLYTYTLQIFPTKITYFSQIGNAKPIGGLFIINNNNDSLYLTYTPPHPDFVEKRPYSIPLPHDIPRQTWTQLITTCVDAIDQPDKYRVRIIRDRGH